MQDESPCRQSCEYKLTSLHSFLLLPFPLITPAASPFPLPLSLSLSLSLFLSLSISLSPNAYSGLRCTLFTALPPRCLPADDGAENWCWALADGLTDKHSPCLLPLSPSAHTVPYICTTAQRSSCEIIIKQLWKLVWRERETHLLGLSFISVSSLLLFLPPQLSAPRAPFIPPHLSVRLRHPPAATSPPPFSLFLRHFTPSVSSCHPACFTSFSHLFHPPHTPFSSRQFPGNRNLYLPTVSLTFFSNALSHLFLSVLHPGHE